MAIAFVYKRRPGAAVVTADPHVHSYTTEVTAPTCEEQGYTEHICECGHSYRDNYVPALGHIFGDAWESDESGHWHICSRCGGKSAIIPHEPSAEGADQVCIVCGYVITPHEHIYSEQWEADETGHWHTCSICGSKSEIIPHTPGAEATELTAQLCTICGYVINPPLEHTHSYTYEVIAPTCTEQGYTVESCSCGSAYKRIYVPALGHDKMSTVTKAPTCTEEGNRYWWCTRCDWSENETIPALGHSPSEGWEYNNEAHFHRCTTCDFAPLDYAEHTDTAIGSIARPAQCISNEIHYKKCPTCGYEFKDRFVEIPYTATGHTTEVTYEQYDGSQHLTYRKCTACGEITTDKKLQNHSLTTEYNIVYEDETNFANDLFHEKIIKCSRCGYKKRSYEYHVWDDRSDAENPNEKTCIHCGYTMPR